MFKFITSRPLWMNILFAIALAFLLLFLFLGSLGFLTRHGKILKIPSVTGKSVTEAFKYLESQGFEVQIQDSVYVDTVPPLQVIKQLPEADELVKVNRTVYLTINKAVAPMVDMPNLIGASFRSAELILKQYGLKLGDTTSKPDFTKNSILSQVYKNNDIKPGTKIPMGSAIDLVLSGGPADYDISVPDLFGMSYSEARVLMESNGLSFLSVVPDAGVTDNDNAYIYWQQPERLDEERRVRRIRPGQTIDIRLGAQKPQRADSTGQAPVQQQ